MRVAVTGAGGFLGGVLVRRLLEANHDVVAIDVVRTPALSGLDVSMQEVDILDADALGRSIQGVEVVFHLASVISVTGDPTGRVRRVNVDGARNVAEAARAVTARMVHCSSVHAFDLESVEVVDESSPRAVADHLPPYDRSKAAGEKAVREIEGLDVVVVNPTGIIGPVDFAPSRMGAVFVAMWNRRLPALVDRHFDWVDVRDVAESLLAAAERGRRDANYLLPGHYVSLPELARLAAQVSGRRVTSRTVPLTLARAWSPIGGLLTRRTGSPLWLTRESLHALEHNPRVSGVLATTELGHSARQVADTVRDTFDWFDGRGLVRSDRTTKGAG